MSVVRIPRRFRGPATSGNGGYSCAMAAQFVDGPAEVTLRVPPPLETPLTVERDGETVRLLDGETLVAEARPATVDADVPEPVTVEQARRAGERSPLLDTHPFPECFVCGPGREPGDGLRIFCGPVDGRELFAAVWTPDASLPAAAGAVAPQIVWAALDCTSAGAIPLLGDVGTAMLGRLAVRIEAAVRVGEPHVALSWPVGRDGRKVDMGAALLTADGALCGVGRARWIELRAAA